MSRFDWSAIPIIALALAADLAVIANVGLPLRALVVFSFLLIGPGLPFVRLLRIRQTAAQFTLTIALSLALDTAVAEGMILARVWSAGTALAALIVVCVAGAVGQMFVSSLGERRGLEE